MRAGIAGLQPDGFGELAAGLGELVAGHQFGPQREMRLQKIGAQPDGLAIA